MQRAEERRRQFQRLQTLANGTNQFFKSVITAIKEQALWVWYKLENVVEAFKGWLTLGFEWLGSCAEAVFKGFQWGLSFFKK